MRCIAGLVVSLVVSAVALGCGSSHGGSGSGTSSSFQSGGGITSLTLTKTSGDGLSVSQGQTFWVAVHLVDQNGSPVSNAAVTFEDGHGLSSTGFTDVDGNDSASVTAPAQSGTLVITATAVASGVTSNAVAFSETVQ